jgi:putative N6-adenine-specific DNA methylase
VNAPLNEILAAGLILLSDWDRKTDFYDLMCGSGTLLIEAALLANNIPPGIYRDSFGFEKWKDFDANLWEQVKIEALKKRINSSIKFYGADISPLAIKIANQNVQHANLQNQIELRVSSFESFNPAGERGFIIMNPPYGLRLKEHDIHSFFKMIGDTLKHNFTGFTAWIISPEEGVIKSIGLRPSKKMKIFNGPLECKFAKFELYKGSVKSKYKN